MPSEPHCHVDLEDLVGRGNLSRLLRPKAAAVVPEVFKESVVMDHAN
jgi:hypothetical protein